MQNRAESKPLLQRNIVWNDYKERGDDCLMRIAIGCDHAGYDLKMEIKGYLVKRTDDEYKDFGTNSKEPCDYPDFALQVAKAVASGDFDRGILICGKCGNSLIGKAGNGHLANGTKRRNYVCPVRRDDTEECGKVAVAVHRVEPAVRDLVVRILAAPKHARQIARASAKLAAAQAKLDAAQSDATELSRRLGEGRMPLDRYDAAMGPLELRITRLKRDVDALKGAGADQAAHTASVEEITREWDEADVATRRAMIRRVAPRGILVKTVTRGEFSRMSDTAERLVVL